jgi:uncharacterized protein
MDSGSSAGQDFLGAGIAFPLGVDPQGRIVMNSLEEHVRQSIELILRTAKGERVMRPDFGSGLYTLVFESVSAVTLSRVQHEVQDALQRFEPRIDVQNVDVTGDPTRQGVLLINIQYRVRSTDASFNLVYPFYLERGEL